MNVAWNDEQSVAIGHATRDERTVFGIEQCHVGKLYGTIVAVHQMTDVFSFRLLYTLHIDVVAFSNGH